MAACVVYYLLERARRAAIRLAAAGATDRIVWSDLWRFDRSYWYIVGLCVTFYSVIFPFRSTFAIKYFQHAHGLSLQEAGAMNGYVFLAAIFATPAFGLLADRVGRRAAFMAFGSFLLAAAFPDPRLHATLNLWITTVMIGIAFSLVPAVHLAGGALSRRTQSPRHGVRADDDAAEHRADGRSTCVAGALNDANGAGADNPGRLHADAVDVLRAEPLRLRVRGCAAGARSRARRDTGSRRSARRLHEQ